MITPDLNIPKYVYFLTSKQPFRHLDHTIDAA
jgi:hypothetical protein